MSNQQIKRKGLSLMLISVLLFIPFTMIYQSGATLICGSGFVCSIKLGSNILDQNIEFKNSSNIQVIKGIENNISLNFNGSASANCNDFVCRIVLDNGTKLFGNITFSKGNSINITKNAQVITIGLNSTVNSVIHFFQDLRTTATACVGLNLVAGLQPIDELTCSGGQGSVLKLFNGSAIGFVNKQTKPFGLQAQCYVVMRVIGTTVLTIKISIRDQVSPNIILCNVNCATSGISGQTKTCIGSWNSTGINQFNNLGINRLVSVYTQGGNGAMDFIFKTIEMRVRDCICKDGLG